MSRRRKADKREIIPDTKFNDKVLSKFINIVMYDGKKSKSEKIVYDALDIASKKLKISKPIDLFKTALNNVKPGIEVRSRRVGGATYQVPVEVRNERAQALAIRWIVDASRKRNEKSMVDRLAQELADAHENKGTSIKKREEQTCNSTGVLEGPSCAGLRCRTSRKQSGAARRCGPPGRSACSSTSAPRTCPRVRPQPLPSPCAKSRQKYDKTCHVVVKSGTFCVLLQYFLVTGHKTCPFLPPITCRRGKGPYLLS